MTLKDKCMLCGNPAYLGFIAMECTGVKCKNYSAKLVNEISNIQKEPKTDASYVNVIPPVYPYKFQVGDQVEVIGSNNLKGWTGTIKRPFISSTGKNSYEIAFNKRGVIPVHETDLTLSVTASGAVVVPTPSPHAPGTLVVPAAQKPIVSSGTNKYDIGDRVVVKNSAYSQLNGKVATVTLPYAGPVNNQCYEVTFDDGTTYKFDESYLDPAPGTLTALQNRPVTPPQVNSATPFKIGDQVVINHPGNQNHNLIGVIVKEFTGPGDWYVEINGTNYRYTDAYFLNTIPMAGPSTPAPFKVGDKVVVVSVGHVYAGMKGIIAAPASYNSWEVVINGRRHAILEKDLSH